MGKSQWTNCDAVEIGTVWNVCAVDKEEPTNRGPWQLGTHRVSSGDLFGKESVGTSRSNKFEALASEEESEDEEADDSGDGEGESGRASILKAPLRKSLAAATAAEDPTEKWLDCPPGLNKGGPVEEKSGDPDLKLKHDCVGECCSGGFLEVSTLRKKKRREWRTLRFEDSNDIEICPIENESVTSEKKESRVMNLGFQVADVKKPLIAVKRITERGNHVMFRPQQEDNYIWNKATGQKMMLKPSGRGSYVMEVQFVGGEKTMITVDSGAEESVCPWEWGERLFGTQHSKEHMQFKNARGGTIEHWGQREVRVTSTF